MELTTDKSYDKLVKRIRDFNKALYEETVFLQKTEEMEVEVAKFQKRVEDEKTLLVRALQTTSENVGKLKDEYEVCIPVRMYAIERGYKIYGFKT